MTDRDVEREIEANKERERARDRAAEDDGPIIDTAEEILEPVTDIVRPDDGANREGAERRRRLNDEEQRQGQ